MQSMEQADTIETAAGRARVYGKRSMEKLGCDVAKLPYSIRVLLENSLRNSSARRSFSESASLLSEWPKSVDREMHFMPYRVLLQDYTGVPLVVDLAAMRDAAKSAGINPKEVNSKVPVDLIIDHSIQVDFWG
ncbi:MAG TPA: aconitase family protein, partial [Nitrososphaerales archaeon]|nr:aconitase family protein [Nitrososphaerales archaeon]